MDIESLLPVITECTRVCPAIRYLTTVPVCGPSALVFCYGSKVIYIWTAVSVLMNKTVWRRKLCCYVQNPKPKYVLTLKGGLCN